MDEFAYGFVTRNAHFGTTRNPVDRLRIAGGSSGGTAAAVAAGFVPIALGSDTNGSIRVPAALCGVWALRPGDGRIAHDGMFPFSKTLDQPGLIARSAIDLRHMFESLRDAAPPEKVSPHRPPRVARLTGWFARNADAGMQERLEMFANQFGDVEATEIEGAERARSAAFLITAAEGGALHADTLKTHWAAYDPATRDRLAAGAVVPARVYIAALTFRRSFRREVSRLFEQFDFLIAPTTPVVAPLLEEELIVVNGKEVSARANLGILTQPLSLAGIPVVSAPAEHPSRLPMGIQIAAAPGREEALLDFAVQIERAGLLGFAHPSRAADRG